MIWAWHTCQTQTPNCINERNVVTSVQRPRANIIYKKFLFSFEEWNTWQTVLWTTRELSCEKPDLSLGSLIIQALIQN